MDDFASFLSETTSIFPRASSVDPDRRMSPDFIVDLLRGVVEVHEVERRLYIGDETKVAILKFADGILEELLSQEFRHGPASRFSFDEKQAKETIALTCLSLLLDSATHDAAAKNSKAAKMYCLNQFAALFWTDFLDLTNLSRSAIEPIEQLFLRDRQAFDTWITILEQADTLYHNSKHSSMLHHITKYTEKGPSAYAPPLVWASALNLLSIVETLLEDGCPVNECGEAGVSALYMAVQQKNYSIASVLLEAGGDVADGYQELTGKYEHNWKVSPLYLVGLYGHSRDWIHLLLKDKSKVGKPGWRTEVAVETAARHGHYETVEALIDAGADVDKPSGNEECFGCPLQAACSWSKNGVVKLLLERGANPNTTGGKYIRDKIHTPLQTAARWGDVESVQLLLEYGADPNLEGGVYGSAVMASIWIMHKAPDEGTLEVLELLLQHGDRTDMEWDMGPKLYELNYEYPDDEHAPLDELFGDKVAEWVESNKIDTEDMSPGSEFTLHEKIEKKWECIHEGRQQNKYPYMCGCMNQKAFESRFEVCKRIRKSAALISKRLHEAGVQRDPQGKYMMTPIQAAVAMDRPSMVQALLHHGASMPVVLVRHDDEAHSVGGWTEWALKLWDAALMEVEMSISPGAVWCDSTLHTLPPICSIIVAQDHAGTRGLPFEFTVLLTHDYGKLWR
ncbi:hypothetical protein G7Y79_00046g081980 [Physcia stellaris]|nr:hypothetical protein G7Y79_00046g081980 [Physcia stellaris]